MMMIDTLRLHLSEANEKFTNKSNSKIKLFSYLIVELSC